MSITDKPRLETKQLGAVAKSQARDDGENRYARKENWKLLIGHRGVVSFFCPRRTRHMGLSPAHCLLLHDSSKHA